MEVDGISEGSDGGAGGGEAYVVGVGGVSGALEEGRKEKFGAKVIRCSCGAKLEGFRRMRWDGLCESCEVKGVCGKG